MAKFNIIMYRYIVSCILIQLDLSSRFYFFEKFIQNINKSFKKKSG